MTPANSNRKQGIEQQGTLSDMYDVVVVAAAWDQQPQQQPQ